MKKDEGNADIIKNVSWDRVIDRILGVLRCSNEELGKQVGVTRQAIEGYHAKEFYPKDRTALALLCLYSKISEPIEGQSDMLILNGLSSSQSRIVKLTASEFKKQNKNAENLQKGKAEAENERRKAEIELIKINSSNS